MNFCFVVNQNLKIIVILLEIYCHINRQKMCSSKAKIAFNIISVPSLNYPSTQLALLKC